MDSLHATLRSLRTETKAARDPLNDPLNVFREFLAQLDALQRKPPMKAPRVKAHLRRKPARRGRG
jgi:hypothetical protein